MTTLLPMFIIVILSISISVHSQCLKNQRSLLLQFLDAMYDPYDSSKLRTWNSSTDCCSWGGLTCDLNGNVIGLDLGGEGFSGVIDDSSSLFDLRNLEHLNLANNDFEGQEIPAKFNRFANLSYLNLSYTGFIGQIPLEISNLTNLIVLDFSSTYFDMGQMLMLEGLDLTMLVQNLSRLTELYLDGVHISGKAWWSGVLSSSLSNLRVLSLSHCQLSGPIDSSLQKLRSLSVLDLSLNNFSSPFPEFFAKFSNLSSLILSGSGLHGIVPEKLFHIPSLKILDFSFNDQLYGSLPDFHHNGSLQELVLSQTSFSGIIPNSVGNLQNLQYLSLAGNNFTGSIPNSICNLQNLQYLSLDDNNFTGLIPYSIGNLQYLQYLDLARNNFIGLIPNSIANLKELVHLDLSFNNLMGPVPSLSSLKRLDALWLTSNKLNGSISSTDWEELSDLTYLDLSDNSLSGDIPWSLFNTSGLEVANLSYNQFNGLLNEFPKLSSSQLHTLDLSCNQIHGGFPSWIWEMKNLEWLNVSHNFLVEVGEPSKGLISNLEIFDLHANQIQGQIQLLPSFVQYIDYSSNNFSSVIPPAFFRNLNLLNFLFLSNNNFQGSIPHSICNKVLTFLDLSNNSFNGTIPKCLFESSPSLTALKLSSNKLNGPIPDKFASDSQLDYLDLSKNLLEGKIPRSMANCKLLKFLNLGKNQLSDIFPVHLMKIFTIQVLVLESNKLHGSMDCRETNGSWSNLHIINIASNNFSGEIPENCLRSWVALVVVQNDFSNPLGFSSWSFNDGHGGSLTYGGLDRYFYETYVTTTKGQERELSKVFVQYTAIDFSCNNFQGKIPKFIGELKQLRILNLSHNAFIGEIPASIGKLENLESLDLSRNNLSGEIPSEFASISFLEWADFSYNQLVGQIPTGRQLQTFPSSFFEGNPELCGPPLKKECPQPYQPTKEPDDHSNSKSGIEWSFISIEVGFTFGLGVVILPITFSRRWRIRYYRCVERVLFKLLPRLDPWNYKSRERKVGNLQTFRRR